MRPGYLKFHSLSVEMPAPSNDPDRKDQQHPQWSKDRQVADRLLREDPSPITLAELARLRIRYRGFPGGRDIQRDLDKALAQWGLSEEALFEKTREIHQGEQIYTIRSNKKEDWT